MCTCKFMRLLCFIVTVPSISCMLKLFFMVAVNYSSKSKSRPPTSSAIEIRNSLRHMAASCENQHSHSLLMTVTIPGAVAGHSSLHHQALIIVEINPSSANVDGCLNFRRRKKSWQSSSPGVDLDRNKSSSRSQRHCQPESMTAALPNSSAFCKSRHSTSSGVVRDRSPQ